MFQSISAQEKIDFVRNLSLLIKSGVPINQAFDILAKQAKSEVLKKTLISAKEKIEKGSPISEVFANNPNFEPIFASFINTGEESGTLVENLIFLADLMEKRNKLKKEINKITLYPKIIIVFALFLGTGLALFILPGLVPIFGALEVELPITTRILLWISELMKVYGIHLVIGLFLFILFIWLLLKLKPVAKIVDKIILRIPVVGILIRDYQLTMISQLISILIKSGLTISRALEITSQTVPNFEYKKALIEIKERVTKGTRLNEAMRVYPRIFPEIFSAIVATGEETGTASESFNYLADFFSSRVKEKVEKLPVIIEPILLILIGFFVLFIASAIILPIYEITRGLR